MSHLFKSMLFQCVNRMPLNVKPSYLFVTVQDIGTKLHTPYISHASPQQILLSLAKSLFCFMFSRHVSGSTENGRGVCQDGAAWEGEAIYVGLPTDSVCLRFLKELSPTHQHGRVTFYFKAFLHYSMEDTAVFFVLELDNLFQAIPMYK